LNAMASPSARPATRPVVGPTASTPLTLPTPGKEVVKYGHRRPGPGRGAGHRRRQGRRPGILQNPPNVARHVAARAGAAEPVGPRPRHPQAGRRGGRALGVGRRRRARRHRPRQPPGPPLRRLRGGSVICFPPTALVNERYIASVPAP
jgi:hypothetical protein